MEEPNTETDQGIFIPNEDAATEQPAQFLDSNDVGCPKCGKRFKNDKALRMHTIRKHGKGWSTAGNFTKGKRKESEAERLAKRRIYQKKLRNRYYREGKDSRGIPREPGFQPKPRGGNRGMHLPKWSPSRLAKFKRTMKQKAMARAGNNMFDAGGEKPTPPTPPVRATVLCCPRCGLNIEVVRKAMEFAERI